MPKVIGARRYSDFTMQSSHPLHMVPAQQANNAIGKTSSTQNFGELLQGLIQGVEKIDNTSKKLTTQSVYDPNSVEVHKVLLAAEKARFTLNFTKAISDGMIRAFKELSSPR